MEDIKYSNTAFLIEVDTDIRQIAAQIVSMEGLPEEKDLDAPTTFYNIYRERSEENV